MNTELTTTSTAPAVTTQPALVRGLSMADYHADRTRVSKHGLDLVARAPILYKLWKERQLEEEEKDYLTLGTLIHTAVLEPKKIRDTVAILPDDAPNKPSSRQINAKKPSLDTLDAIAWWERFNKEAAGKTIINLAQADMLVEIAKSVRSNPYCADLLAGTEGVDIDTESSIYWTNPETGLPCRCRPDRIRSDGLVIDVKSCADASAEAFIRSAHNYRYHVQAPWYLDAVRESGRKAEQFVFICVETKKPYLTNVFVAAPAFLEAGRMEYVKNITKLNKCLLTNEWPGLSETGMVPLNLPKWVS